MGTGCGERLDRLETQLSAVNAELARLGELADRFGLPGGDRLEARVAIPDVLTVAVWAAVQQAAGSVPDPQILWVDWRYSPAGFSADVWTYAGAVAV